MAKRIVGRARRKIRVRKKISGTPERPRMSVFRSAKHISAQVIDDTTGKTIAAASSYSKAFEAKAGGNMDGAKAVGEMIAKQAMENGVSAVVFDRSGYRYHGRVKALADAARQKGLKF